MTKATGLNILHVSQLDISGGAEQVCWDLHLACIEQGHRSHMLVGWKRTNRHDVTECVPTSGIARLCYRIIRRLEFHIGIQAWGYWTSESWWKANRREWDIIHLHNLHGSYFDLGLLPKMGKYAKLVITLHDNWLLTGHCAHPQKCERWKSGCGQCPDLATYPGIAIDNTGLNWKRKRAILQETHPVLVSPSGWLAGMVSQSPILSHLPSHTIYNGVDPDRFCPGDRRQARQNAGLSPSKMILIYVANGGLNSSWHKAPHLLIDAMRNLLADGFGDRIHLVVVGGQTTLPPSLEAHITQFGDVRAGLETIYQAANVLVYPTKADNCPLVPLEAMSCGLPVIATRIGGLPELVVNGETGYLIQPGNVEGFTAAIRTLLEEPMLLQSLGQAARDRVRQKFTLAQTTAQYLSLYAALTKEPEH